MKLELLAKSLNELIKNRPEFADKDICIEQTTNDESKLYVAEYDETNKRWTKLYWIRNLDNIKESISKTKNMKTYKVKNYKGNLVESLKRFSDSHKGMKIVEAVEDGDDLKIKTEDYNQDYSKEIVKWVSDKTKDLFDLTISDDLSNGNSEHTKELLKMFENFLK